MFDPASRYAKLGTEILTVNGGQVNYVMRRFLPRPDSISSVQQVKVVVGDRMDLIGTRALGDPEQFWRICDANPIMYPLEASSRPGTILRVPAPGG
jgi:nucleoid-associated protein YgaU